MQISVVTCFFLEETLRKLADTGDQRFVIGDATGGCGKRPFTDISNQPADDFSILAGGASAPRRP